MTKKLKTIKADEEANEALKVIKRLGGQIAARIEAFNEERWPHYEQLGEENLPDQEEVARLEELLESFMRECAKGDECRSITVPAGRLALRHSETVKFVAAEEIVLERLKAASLHELIARSEKVNKQAVKARGLEPEQLKKLYIAIIEEDSFHYKLAEVEPLPPAA
ncbi:host-nuclease inhibitor Gam family protein [Nitrospinae bacterium AH_259_B05_G02_I21]|nr:host-nuclease inhibitor Gam family protein [Nitrospinae bacterium AH_259_B05_G02_I21]